MPTCIKCGPDVPQAFFTESGTMCDQCWEIHDMDRFKEARPKNHERPTAKAVKLSTGDLGILCPHCDYRVHRKRGYFRRLKQTERCPKCLNHYVVNVKGAI